MSGVLMIVMLELWMCCYFFFNDTATTEIYTYCTLFPYTTLFRSPGVLDALLQAGVDVVRLNFSHGDPDAQRARALAVREAAARVGKEDRKSTRLNSSH